MPRYVVWSVPGKIIPAVCTGWYTSGSLTPVTLQGQNMQMCWYYCVPSVDGSMGAPNTWGQQQNLTFKPHSWNLTVCSVPFDFNTWYYTHLQRAPCMALTRILYVCIFVYIPWKLGELLNAWEWQEQWGREETLNGNNVLWKKSTYNYGGKLS